MRPRLALSLYSVLRPSTRLTARPELLNSCVFFKVQSQFQSLIVPATISRTALASPCKAPHLMANCIFAIFSPRHTHLAHIHGMRLNSTGSATGSAPLPATAGGPPPAGSQASTTFDPLLPKLTRPKKSSRICTLCPADNARTTIPEKSKNAPRQLSPRPPAQPRPARSSVVQTQSTVSIPQSRCPAPPEFPPKMHQAADPRDMADFIQPILKNATNKNVTGEKRLNHPHNAAPRCPLHPQTGMKNFQTQILTDIGRCNMLVLGLCSGAIPCWI